ncbi:hypothetical protein BN000_00210 [Neobacillus massiliamazoniensis]|uniref:Uncharacterized protein n=1 Tax=Neobacillus massiliamazoniensis TaxID=1499688 RepID=A0A0U1NQL8_9BACI|nr:hypothetical protein BN000_00210 [Neobacillus massiliamazoniensis]
MNKRMQKKVEKQQKQQLSAILDKLITLVRSDKCWLLIKQNKSADYGR